MKTAYLSGPIMDEHEGVARKWREIAKSLLAPNFRLLNPILLKLKVTAKPQSAQRIFILCLPEADH